MGDRPSEDVDLFTNRADPDEFAAAVDRLRDAYLAAGLRVEDGRVRPTFAEFDVTDPTTGEASSVQLGLDFRAFPSLTSSRPNLSTATPLRSGFAGLVGTTSEPSPATA
jgi:hypothetical protein